jgi:hypothetical protein
MIKTYGESGEWFLTVEDIKDYIEDEGYEVIDINREQVVFVDPDDDDDIEYVASIGGTERTMYIENVTEA